MDDQGKGPEGAEPAAEWSAGREEEEEEDDDDDDDDDDDEEGELGEDAGEGEGGGEEAETEEEMESEEEEEGEAAAAAPVAAAVPVDLTRILTPKDFERIKRLKQLQAQRNMLPSARRLAAEALEEEDQEVLAEGDAVDEMDIRGQAARKAASREEKLANTLAGREDRGSFSGRRKEKTGGKSNKEKRKNNPFMMARKSHQVRSKVKRRDENNRKKRQSQKKQFRGKVRKGA